MGEWQIASRFLDPGYTLIAPDGTEVWTYETLEEAKQAMRDLIEESLEHTEPFTWRTEVEAE